MDCNIFSASKNIHESKPTGNPAQFSPNNRKSKTMMTLINPYETKKEDTVNVSNESKEMQEFKLYERQVSKKKHDVDEEKMENIAERDNDESLNKNFQEKISKMNIVLTPIQTHCIPIHMKFSEAVKVEANSSDYIKKTHNGKERGGMDKIENIINNHPYRHLIFAPYCTESTFKKHLTLTY